MTRRASLQQLHYLSRGKRVGMGSNGLFGRVLNRVPVHPDIEIRKTAVYAKESCLGVSYMFPFTQIKVWGLGSSPNGYNVPPGAGVSGLKARSARKSQIYVILILL